MAFPFDQLMHDLAAYLQSSLDVEREMYSLVVPLPSGRQQEIVATIKSVQDGREVIDFVSTVGVLRGDIDPWRLLELNGHTTFARITIGRQMIFVVANQLLATAQPEEVLLILREVAEVADQLERDYFQNDAF